MTYTFTTAGGVGITRTDQLVDHDTALDRWITRLDHERGCVFTSSYEFPGRYIRWDFALVDPPLVVEAKGRKVTVKALNPRGRPLLSAAQAAFTAADLRATRDGDVVTTIVPEPHDELLFEEDRSRRPTAFTALRALRAFFATPEDAQLGFAGAFGYDLALQFDPIPLVLERPDSQRDFVLYFPDEILAVDHYAKQATVASYEFLFDEESTDGVPRVPSPRPLASKRNAAEDDHKPGEYADTVRRAFDYFKRGDLFEVVPSQTFRDPLADAPSAIMRRLTRINPSPYGFFINLGEDEFLVGASPEMFVRVTGRRVETCPISGTIKRGRDAIEDEEQIRKLLNSTKDETELTMCSDVDRNDKSRVCEPESVRVLGRRQIEMYSRLIHTVDHIEGILLQDRDALDAFLSHAWAVTVTGAPKRRAMTFIEANERSPRAWYGGAVGLVHLNGDLNTGLTLRTVHIRDGVAEVRAGATVLADSDADAEEEETVLKASAMRAAIRGEGADRVTAARKSPPGAGKRALLVDHDDSFVHTLAGYLRRCGLEVVTLRSPVDRATFARIKPDIVVMSPGPGIPSDFDCTATIHLAESRRLPVFGVCLGLQAMVESQGGKLAFAPPMHGKPSTLVTESGSRLFDGIAGPLTVGRYHSLVADPDALPKEFVVTARAPDGAIMAIEHQSAPMMAVQFHPESIMSLGNNVGMAILENAITALLDKAPSSEAAA
ncbi:anthranilate synthase component I [Acuticoccus sp. I52.16.1]|uniref:anthranilate synthase component I n=1 Tax=Acuticoccus sp. I52.16.1 TaxID=2928472 RepID=UPI001FD4423E|nr:anthranilate synthase component I [Acuticoccus sp. I52.16.1]UOM34126.1 anthranilate synthase component I [Acuticoccus sp. I52.16.1]